MFVMKMVAARRSEKSVNDGASSPGKYRQRHEGTPRFKSELTPGTPFGSSSATADESCRQSRRVDSTTTAIMPAAPTKAPRERVSKAALTRDVASEKIAEPRDRAGLDMKADKRRRLRRLFTPEMKAARTAST